MTRNFTTTFHKNVIGLHLFKAIRDIERFQKISKIINEKHNVIKDLERNFEINQNFIIKYARESGSTDLEKGLINTLINRQILTRVYIKEFRLLQFKIDQCVKESTSDLEYINFKIFKQ